MAISQSVSPQERIIMEASRKFYMERLNEELSSLIAYKKRAETCKENDEILVSPIPRYDRYMLPIPKVPKPEKEEQIEDKVTKRAKSPETRRQRSQTTEGGLFQKRERVQANDRRHLLESLKKVQGWIESNDAGTQSEADEPTGKEITDKLAAITLRDEKDAMLESEMKDKRDRVAIVPPVCSPNLDVTITRERRPTKGCGSKMVSLKTSVISLEISEPMGSKSNFGLTLAMKKVGDNFGGHRQKASPYEQEERTVGLHDVALAFGGCGTLTDLDVATEPVNTWHEFRNFEGGDQVMTVNRNLGGWDCDRLEKKNKYDGDLRTTHKVGEVGAEESVINLQNHARLKSIALKLSDYTKLKSMAVAVGGLAKSGDSRVRKSNDNSKQELISVKTSEIFPQFGRNREVIGNELRKKHVKWGNDSETLENTNQSYPMKPKKQCQNVGTQHSERDFPVRTIRSDNSAVRSFGTNTRESEAATKKPRHRPTQRRAEDDDHELVEILPPQFKLTDEPQSDNEVIICGYLGLKNDPRPEFNIVVESSDEQQDTAESDRKRRVKRRRCKVRSGKLRKSAETTDSGGGSGDGMDSESREVSTMLERLEICPGLNYSLEGLGTLTVEPLQLEKYTVNKSKKTGGQQDGYKPDWLKNYSSKIFNNECFESEANASSKEILVEQIRQEEIGKGKNVKWEKKSNFRSPVKRDTSLDIPTLRGVDNINETPHFNSPTREDARDKNPVCVVSASATSVANVVLAARQTEERSPRLSRSSLRHDRHNVKKLGAPKKTATQDGGTSSTPHSRASFDKRSGRRANRIDSRGMSTGVDFIQRKTDFKESDSDSSENEQARLLSQVKLFNRPNFTLDPLKEFTNKNKNGMSSLPSLTSAKRDLVTLERVPIRRRVSNEELAKTKNEINNLLSKTSEILQRNDTERDLLRQGNSLSLYREMTADLRKDCKRYATVKPTNGLYVSKEDAFPLTDPCQGYESDGSVGNCPMNSLVSLVSSPKPDDVEKTEKNFLPKRVAGNMNLLQTPDDLP